MTETLVNEHKSIYLTVIDDEQLAFINELVANDLSHNGKAKKFEIEFGIKYEKVLCFGDTEEVDNKLLGDLIPECIYKAAPKPRDKSYYCYATRTPSMVLHEDLRSAWKCLMNTLNNPNYVLIYQK